MACLNKYEASCPNPQCRIQSEPSCKHFKPFPPRMTEVEFVKKQDELLKNIPEEFKGAMSYRAWEDGHAYGFEEVLNHLTDLIADLEEPIMKFMERVKKEAR
jgi:hypothetical protein